MEAEAPESTSDQQNGHGKENHGATASTQPGQTIYTGYGLHEYLDSFRRRVPRRLDIVKVSNLDVCRNKMPAFDLSVTQLEKEGDEEYYTRLKRKVPLIAARHSAISMMYTWIGGNWPTKSAINVPRNTLKKLVHDPATDVLFRLNEGDFAIISSFLLTGEYPPVLIEACGVQHPLNPQPSRPGEVTYILEGLQNQQDYDREFLRFERVYCLARMLNLTGLKLLVLRKMKLGYPRLNEPLVLDLTNKVFGSVNRGRRGPRCIIYPTKEPFEGRYERERDPMRAFLVDYFASAIASETIQSKPTSFNHCLNKYPELRVGAFVRAAELELDKWMDWKLGRKSKKSKWKGKEEDLNGSDSDESDSQGGVAGGNETPAQRKKREKNERKKAKKRAKRGQDKSKKEEEKEETGEGEKVNEKIEAPEESKESDADESDDDDGQTGEDEVKVGDGAGNKGKNKKKNKKKKKR